MTSSLVFITNLALPTVAIQDDTQMLHECMWSELSYHIECSKGDIKNEIYLGIVQALLWRVRTSTFVALEEKTIFWSFGLHDWGIRIERTDSTSIYVELIIIVGSSISTWKPKPVMDDYIISFSDCFPSRIGFLGTTSNNWIDVTFSLDRISCLRMTGSTLSKKNLHDFKSSGYYRQTK